VLYPDELTELDWVGLVVWLGSHWGQCGVNVGDKSLKRLAVPLGFELDDLMEWPPVIDSNDQPTA
jgi:hypothetical protein